VSNFALAIELRNEDDGGICNATVTADQGGQLSQLSADGGCFFLGGRGPGTYRVDVSASGYEEMFEENINVALVSAACPNYSVVTAERRYVLQRLPDGGL